MEWLVMVVLVAAGTIGGLLVLRGKRDPQTRDYLPGFFRQPGSNFEPNRRHDKKPTEGN